MRIAVIGTGIAGLASAWLLSKHHEVTVIERATTPGMAAHAVTVGDVRMDVPLRVFYAGYYPRLMALYAEASVRTEPVDYSTTFAHLSGQTYFRYRNVHVGARALPVPSFRGTLARQILADIARFLARDQRDVRSDETVGDFLSRHDYSEAFARQFLLPAFAGIATVSYAQVRDYPARIVAEYMTSGILLESVRRATDGTREVCKRLLSRVTAQHNGVAVTGVSRTDAGVDVIAQSGYRGTFDHVVLATQATHAHALLSDVSAAEDRALVGFKTVTARVVTHTDPALAPQDPSDWSPVNFLVSPDAPAPMATIWMNAVQPGLPNTPALFQTWNPIIEPRPDTVLGDVTLLRPVVTRSSVAAVHAVNTLHAQPNRRVWFAGSYGAHGVPLLESAVQSAHAIAHRLRPDAEHGS